MWRCYAVRPEDRTRDGRAIRIAWRSLVSKQARGGRPCRQCRYRELCRMLMRSRDWGRRWRMLAAPAGTTSGSRPDAARGQRRASPRREQQRKIAALPSVRAAWPRARWRQRHPRRHGENATLGGVTRRRGRMDDDTRRDVGATTSRGNAFLSGSLRHRRGVPFKATCPRPRVAADVTVLRGVVEFTFASSRKTNGGDRSTAVNAAAAAAVTRPPDPAPRKAIRGRGLAIGAAFRPARANQRRSCSRLQHERVIIFRSSTVMTTGTMRLR